MGDRVGGLVGLLVGAGVEVISGNGDGSKVGVGVGALVIMGASGVIDGKTVGMGVFTGIVVIVGVGIWVASLLKVISGVTLGVCFCAISN